MTRSKRFLIALTVMSASFVQVAEALAGNSPSFGGMNHNETLVGDH